MQCLLLPLCDFPVKGAPSRTGEQMTAFFFSNFVLEIHLLPKKTKSFHLYIWKKARRLVVLTPFIKDRLVQIGISAEKIIVSPDGVNLSLFDIPLSKEEAREKLNLPKNKKLVGYVGMFRTLGMEKGVDVLIKAFAGLKEKNSLLVLVGGYKDDIDFYKNMSEKLGISDRVVFVGKIVHNLVPVYLKAFDCLVAPFPKNEHYSFFMSPMKIFEYMASGRPIVSTKLPSLVEILRGSVLLVEPDSAEELKNGIGRVLEDEKFSEGLVTNAYNNVLNYTWQKRAKNILGKIR
jgi:glycosyltransferase involved in cell wall biosynthesis